MMIEINFSPILFIRSLLTAIGVLILPGSSLCFLVFPPDSLSRLSRLFLSITLSVVLSALTGVFLLHVIGDLSARNFLVSILSLTISFFLIGIIRLRQLYPKTKLGTAIRDYLQRFFFQTGLIFVTYVVILFSILFGFEVKKAPGITELYFSDLDKGYQTQLINNQSHLIIPFEIRNLEDSDNYYKVEILFDNNRMAEYKDILVDKNTTWRGRIFVPEDRLAGESDYVEVILFKQPSTKPNARIGRWLGAD